MRQRRPWVIELAVLATVVVVPTVLFWLTDWDLAAARLFYHQENPADPWPVARLPVWRFFYHATRWMAAGFGVGGLALVVSGMSWRRRTAPASEPAPAHDSAAAHKSDLDAVATRRQRRRLYGLFLVLSLGLGPGLLVNAIFKDNLGRPRPRQVEPLGGRLAHLPPLQPGRGGKSFPCGHSSVGFVGGAFYYMLRRRRPRAAAACLLASLALGAVIGAGRMAAGAHFLSDVIWAAGLAYGTVMLVYYVLLRVPWQEDHPGRAVFLDAARLPRWAQAAGATALAFLLLFSVLLAMPYEETMARSFALPRSAAPARRLEVRIDDGNARLILTRGEVPAVRSNASYKGFGLPTSRLHEHFVTLDAGREHLRYHLRREGLFADVEGEVTLRVDAAAVRSLSVCVRNGLLRLESEVPPQAVPLVHLEVPRSAVSLGAGVPSARVLF